MKPGGGKPKGNEFERLICRRLTKWLFGYEKPEKFWRTASSGGKATIDMRKGISAKMHGDVMAIDSECEFFTDRFFVECRSYKDVDVLDIIEGQGLIFKWWFQDCIPKAKECNKVPMLIFKKNRSKIYTILPIEINRWLEGIFGVYPYTTLKVAKNCKIYSLEDLLGWMDGQMLRSVLC